MNTPDKLPFDSLVERFRQPLAAAAYHLCGDREAAQDIVQDTLVSAYRAFHELRDPDRAKAWLYAILRHKVIDHRRKRKPEQPLLDEPHAPALDSAERLVKSVFFEQMRKLSDEDREILAGKYLLELSYTEIAQSLGVKEATVRVKCFRAKERLREALRNVEANTKSWNGRNR